MIVVGFYIWTAIIARKKSDEILSKFNEINNQIKSTNDSITQENGIGAFDTPFQIAYMNTEIILLIDSLKQHYEDMPATPELITPSKQLESDIKRLLKYIQQVNKFKWDMVDSQSPDTIKYWEPDEAFNQEKWFSYFFNKQPKEPSITYLNYLKNEAIKNNH